jgi:DNA mismatch repair ATPase MutL
MTILITAKQVETMEEHLRIAQESLRKVEFMVNELKAQLSDAKKELEKQEEKEEKEEKSEQKEEEKSEQKKEEKSEQKEEEKSEQKEEEKSEQKEEKEEKKQKPKKTPKKDYKLPVQDSKQDWTLDLKRTNDWNTWAKKLAKDESPKYKKEWKKVIDQGMVRNVNYIMNSLDLDIMFEDIEDKKLIKDATERFGKIHSVNRQKFLQDLIITIRPTNLEDKDLLFEDYEDTAGGCDETLSCRIYELLTGLKGWL